MKIAFALVTALAGVLGLISGFQLTSKELKKHPRLKWIERFRFQLRIATLVTALVAVIIGIPQKVEKPIEQINGPKGDPITIARKDTIETEIRATSDSRSKRAIEFFKSGDALMHSGEFAGAVGAYRQSADLVPTKPALVNLAIAERYASDLDASIDAARRALKVERDKKHRNDAVFDALAKLQIGIGLSALGKRDDAGGYLHDALAEFTYLGDQSGLASAEYEMGLFEYRAGRTRVALPLFESAEKRYALEDSIAGRAHALNAMAVIHLDLGQTDLGVKYLRDAAAAFSDAHDATGEAGTLLNLGTAQQDRCELKDALLSYTQATTNARNAHNLSLAALAQANIAGLYIEMRDPAEARSSAQHALDLCSGITSPESQGWAHLYSGAADILSGDIGHATDEIDAARKSLENTNAVGRIAVKIHEAKLHEANGRPDLADETLTAALALAADAEFDTERVDVLFASAEIFLARNNMKGAKESLEKTKEVCDRGHLSQCDCRSAAERLAQLPPI